MQKFFLISGGVLGMLGVVIGAFGAHALKSRLVANGRLDTFETAVKYQFYHALALILLGLIMNQWDQKAFVISGYGFLTGTLLFSGSLYVLAIAGITRMGAVAPFGGLAMILGWAAMCWGLMKAL